jgi:hypothetical protein
MKSDDDQIKLMAAIASVPPCTEDEWQEGVRKTNEEWSRVVLPQGWVETRPHGIGPGLAEMLSPVRFVRHGKSTVAFSVGRHDGQLWLHVSLGHPERLPSYMDLVEVKRIFVGRDRQAVQVFAREVEHVNIHPRVLHLWTSLEPAGDGLPAFGRYGTI